MLLVGVAAGVLGGLFGIGGGLVIVPALVLMEGLDQKTATGTSLFALLWPVGILGVLEYYRRGELKVVPGAWVAVGLVLGIFLGALITAPLSPTRMKQLYGAFLLAMGLYYLSAWGPKPKAVTVIPTASRVAESSGPEARASSEPAEP
jgi:uncharacterized membrane protein YfcA